MISALSRAFLPSALLFLSNVALSAASTGNDSSTNLSASSPVAAESSTEATGEAQRGRGSGNQNRQRQGQGRGRGRGRGQQDEQLQADQQLLSYLIQNRSKITRTVKNLDNGVETITESYDAEVAKAIQSHVKSMYQRVENGNGIHLRDPLFRAVFTYAEVIEMKAEATNKGVHVVETSSNAYAVKLIQAHAAVVSLFIKNGPDEVRKNHDVPNQ